MAKVQLSLVFGTNPDLNKPGLATIDNIDATNRHQGNAYGHDDTSDIKSLDGILSDHG